MTVQELINKLEQVKDKTAQVGITDSEIQAHERYPVGTYDLAQLAAGSPTVTADLEQNNIRVPNKVYIAFNNDGDHVSNVDKYIIQNANA